MNLKTRLLLLIVTICFGEGSHAQFLKTKRTVIVNESGDTVLLRGMGLGGWMLQEGYMMRLSNLGQQHRIREKIVDVVGEEKASQFYDQWLLHHTTKADIDSLAAWGFNSVRLPMHYDLFTLPVDKEPVKGKHTWIDKGFSMTDSLLSWCRANRLWLILDLHAAPGGQGNDLAISDRDPSKPSLWDSKTNQEKMIAFWKKIAERYANDPWIGGYDIINEPNWGFEDSLDKRGITEKTNAPLRELMIRTTKAIREVDKKHIIIIEGNGFGNNYRGIFPSWDDNLVISFHKYGNFNNDESIAQFLALREKHQMPVWLGESGENSNTWFNEAISLVEKKGIGWAWWPMKKMGINNPLEIKTPSGYNLLRDYWAGKGPKPTKEDAWKTLQELLQNIHISKNIYHPDVVDAMIRQVQTTATKPYRINLVQGEATSIRAVDYDMGRQRHAYYDTDSSRYQYTPGVNTDGNRGHAYRNDGVDIQGNPDSPYVFNIEKGEWLQYTVDVIVPGKYELTVTTAAEKPGGIISLEQFGNKINSNISIPVTAGMQDWKTSPVSVITLDKGLNSFRLHMIEGGFNLSLIQLVKKN